MQQISKVLQDLNGYCWQIDEIQTLEKYYKANVLY